MIHNKLVRDKILEIISKDSVEFKSHILSDEEYKKELLAKIVEEANEVLDTNGDKNELVKEISDVMEVLDAIIVAFDLDIAEIVKV